MKQLVLFLFAGLFMILGTACQEKTHPNMLTIGMDLSYPPFEMLDEQGNPTGITIELAQALSSYLQRPLAIKNIPFVGLIPSLQSKKIDLIISSMSDTSERRESIAFSDPYLKIGLGFLVKKTSSITSLQELDHPGNKIAVRLGTTGQIWAQKHITKATLLILDKESTAVLEVLQGRVDAFLYDTMSIWKHHQEHSAETKILLIPLQQESWAIGLRPADKALLEQVNAFLKKFRSEKGFEKLGDRYLKMQKEYFLIQGIPFIFD